MLLARDMAGFDHNEVDKLRKAISKKNDKLFAEVCDLFRKKSIARGIDEKAVDSVLNLMSKFVGYAFNRSHACSYAILSFWTAWLRYYYPHEWLATCIQLAKDDEDKVAMLRKECDIEKINIREPNINESGNITLVNDKNEILLPLSSVKGVGSRADDIITNQPYSDCRDFCFRARPNRGTVMALAESGALSCLSDVEQYSYVEDFIEYWDTLVAERTEEDKRIAKEAKKKFTPAISLNKTLHLDETEAIIDKNKPKQRTVKTRGNIKSLLDENMFD
jgi:DNA polymerase III alpha subunit